MRGPYSEYAAPPIYVYPEPPKLGVRFSRSELVQLLIAILALSAAFTIVYIRYSPSLFARNPVLFLALYFPASLLAVGTGVGLHEIMHKVVAQRYGHWAEFRYDRRGLLMAFVFAAAIGFLYGAPGATWISGAVTREQNGRISAAGPVSNILVAGVFFAAFLTLAPIASGPGGFLLLDILLDIFWIVASVNAFLAGFNMLPILPLDGAKVWTWNKAAYGSIALVAIVLIALPYLGVVV
jgi:Zn-dependent protease